MQMIPSDEYINKLFDYLLENCNEEKLYSILQKVLTRRMHLLLIINSKSSASLVDVFFKRIFENKEEVQTQ